MDWIVRFVRTDLQVDRVFLCQRMEGDTYQVLAESSGEGWEAATARGEAHFSTEWLAQPRWDPHNDIQRHPINPFDPQWLDALHVQTILAVPIWNHDHLWGCLSIHQAQGSEVWDPWVVDYLHQMALHLGLAIHYDSTRQSYAQLKADFSCHHQVLAQQLEQERLLRVVIQNIHRSLDLDEILATALAETRQTFQADRVSIYQFDPDWSGRFIAESVDPGWVILVDEATQTVWEDTYLQETEGGRYRQHQSLAVNDIYTISHHPCHVQILEQFQVRAYLTVPIFVDDRLWGLLAAYQNRGPREWQPWEIDLLEKISLQLAIALRQSSLYQEIQKQVRELEHLNQVKDEFLSTVSHELRSPMASIKMAINMLEISLRPMGVLDDPLNAINRYMNVLRKEEKREISLINDLLDLSRLDSGTDSLHLTELNLKVFIPQLAESFLEHTRQQGQHLVIQVADMVPLFLTDLSYLERILSELLHNACKYTPQGETITVEAEAHGGSLEIRVSNSGIEIPPHEFEHIFEKFYRIPKHDPWKHGGTGLGLALVRKITQRLGGEIRVSSGQNLTTFTLTFNTSL
ncbi:MAG: hypothetical protein OHK0012_15420 [Synechococcales cyanobacterium]